MRRLIGLAGAPVHWDDILLITDIVCLSIDMDGINVRHHFLCLARVH